MCGIPHFINGHEAMTTAETPQIFHAMIIKYLSNTVVYLYLIQLDLANSNSVISKSLSLRTIFLGFAR